MYTYIALNFCSIYIQQIITEELLCRKCGSRFYGHDTVPDMVN
jgi:hypothetical protein